MVETENRVVNFFDQGVQTFGDALKAGVKLQEDTAKWWTDAMEKAGPAQEWQKKGRSVLSEAIPVAQKNAEDLLKVIEQNYRRSVDLVKKACSAEGCEGAPGQAGEIWETSFKMVRDSTQAVTQANMKLMEAWADVLKKATVNGVANGHDEAK